jgi:hypothetical protein
VTDDDDERSLFRDLLPVVQAKVERWGPQVPWPKQQAFLDLTCREALFGGSAGPGKSSGLLMGALQNVHVPGYAALLLRRSFGELALEGGIMDRLKVWLRGDDRVKWSAIDHRFTFPSGATVTFGFCQKEQDVGRYLSTEWQYIGIDELTQWPERWYLELLSRLRRCHGMPANPCMRAASNPGGIGHEWVNKRFGCDGKGPPRDAKNRPLKGCVYIPATARDNPALDIDDYLDKLAQLPITRRRQLELGEWVEDTDGRVYRYDSSRNKAPLPAPLTDPAWSFLLAIDFGVSNATAFVVLGWLPKSRVVWIVHVEKHVERRHPETGDIIARGMDPTGAAEITKGLMSQFAFARIIGDVGGMGKGFAEEMLFRHNIPIEAAEKHNKRGYQALMNASMERAEIMLADGLAEDLATEWCDLPRRPGTDDEMPGYENHACLVAGTMVATTRGEVPIESVVAGDLALTRIGPRRVLWAGPTGRQPIFRLTTRGGRSVEGTWNHPVWTEDGWVRLAFLTERSMVSACVPGATGQPSGEPSWVTCTGATPGLRRVGLRACTSTARTEADRRTFTSRCGNTITGGACPVGSMYITWTGTRSTTPRPTCAPPAEPITSASTRYAPPASPCPEQTWPGTLGQPQLRGTGRQQAELGTPSTRAPRGRSASYGLTDAWCAAEPFAPEGPSPRSVHPRASRSSVETAASTTRTSRVLSAPRCSAGTSTRRPPSVAPDRVLRVEATGSDAPVYDLTVEEAHEFFANGIVVSNSDAALYGWRACMAFLETPEPAPLPPEERRRIAEAELEAERIRRDEAALAEQEAFEADVFGLRAFMDG